MLGLRQSLRSRRGHVGGKRMGGERGEEADDSLLLTQLYHCIFREKGELALCEVSNYLFCGAKVVGASATCLQFLEDNQERYAFHVSFSFLFRSS